MKKSIIVIISCLLILVGCSKVVSNEVSITNLTVTNSAYTNPKLEAKSETNKKYVQINFDLTNNGPGAIKFYVLELLLSYETHKTNVNQPLTFVAPNDTPVHGTIVAPGTKISIQATCLVDTDATNFQIVVRSLSKIYLGKSEEIEKVK